MGEDRFDVLIIGAGVSGIGMACRLRMDAPGMTFAIIERRARIGGTWDLFRFPGVRSDSDMFTYAYGFRPWQDFRVLADGSSIRDYLGATVLEYGLGPQIRHGLKVQRADWSSASQRWTVHALTEPDGEPRRFECRWLIAGTGYYNYDAGYLPDFPGIDRFVGRFVHPQQWPADLDCRGAGVSSSSAAARPRSRWCRRWPKAARASRCCSARRRTCSRCPRAIESARRWPAYCRAAGCWPARGNSISASRGGCTWRRVAGPRACDAS